MTNIWRSIKIEIYSSATQKSKFAEIRYTDSRHGKCDIFTLTTNNFYHFLVWSQTRIITSEH